MKTKYVIKNIPSKLPTQSTMLITFLLYYFKVDNIWWGIFITLYTILWISSIIDIVNEKQIDLNDNFIMKDVASKFQQKIVDLSKKKDETSK